MMASEVRRCVVVRVARRGIDIEETANDGVDASYRRCFGVMNRHLSITCCLSLMNEARL